MKTQIIVAMMLFSLLLIASGCENKPKTIDGYEFIRYGGEYEPVINFCNNCGEYALQKYCIDCGHRMPEFLLKPYCEGCKIYSWADYCCHCGRKTILREQKR